MEHEMTTDPRAQAEQRLMDKMEKSSQTCLHDDFQQCNRCLVDFARLAAEEIAKATIAAWLQPAVECTGEGPGYTSMRTTRREIQWHLVCADKEQPTPEEPPPHGRSGNNPC
jgi:hypothetical protein